MRAFLVAALVLAAGCSNGDGIGIGDGGGTGGAGNVFSCSAAPATADGGASPLFVCLEYSGGTAQDVETYRQSCAAQGDAFALAPCTRTGAVGGCRQIQAGTMTRTSWYYASSGATASIIQTLCQDVAKTVPAGVTIQFVSP